MDSNIHTPIVHGDTPEKSDDRKNGSAAISVFLSDSVRHFKNIQNTHNSGHISSNFSNDNEKNNHDNADNNNNMNINVNNNVNMSNNNNNNNINIDNNNNNNDNNNDNKNFNFNNNDITNTNKINKIKEFDNDDNIRKNGPQSPGVRGSPKGIKDWILAAKKDIDEIWILNEIKNSDNKNKNDNPIFSTCFSTSSSTSTSTSASNTASSPPSVANFKVKVILRTRADGPTKVRGCEQSNIFVFSYYKILLFDNLRFYCLIFGISLLQY